MVLPPFLHLSPNLKNWLSADGEWLPRSAAGGVPRAAMQQQVTSVNCCPAGFLSSVVI